MDFDKAIMRKDDEDIAKEEWAPESEEISVADIDRAVMEYASDRASYEDAKATSDEAHAVSEKSKMKLIDLLTSSGKEKYHVSGLGSVGISQSLKVRVPDGNENKMKMFDWIEKNEGVQALHAYATIHHGTLQTFYSAMKEKYGAGWHLPGLELPQLENKLSFRREK
jgi:hypothetical protein